MSIRRYTSWLAIPGVIALVALTPFIASGSIVGIPAGAVVVTLGWLAIWLVGAAWMRSSSRTRPVLAPTIVVAVVALVVVVLDPSILGAITG